jgi:hypothetical protein
MLGDLSDLIVTLGVVLALYLLTILIFRLGIALLRRGRRRASP